MRVTAVRTALVTAPWTGDPSWVGGAAFERTAALVIVETDEGLTGLGEPIMGYFHADVVPPLIDYYAQILAHADNGKWDGTLISNDGVHPTGEKSNDYSEENLKKSGYALRNYLSFMKYREVYFKVLSAR